MGSGGNNFDIADKITASNFRQKKTGENTHEIESKPEVSLPTPNEVYIDEAVKKRLSEIIDEINAAYNKSFDVDVATKSALQMRDILLKNGHLRDSARNNSLKDFRFAYFDAVQDALIAGYEQNQDFFTLLLDNDEKKRELMQVFLEDVYVKLRDNTITAQNSFDIGSTIKISNATEQEVINAITTNLNCDLELSQTLIHCLQELQPSQEVYNHSAQFPEPEPGIMQLMVMIHKINVNISKVALEALSFLLGLIPVLGTIHGVGELCIKMQGSIVKLTEHEKAMIILLRALSYDGRDELSIVNIRRVFRKYSKVTAVLNDEEKLNEVLDSLDEKGLIEIKTETVKVLR